MSLVFKQPFKISLPSADVQPYLYLAGLLDTEMRVQTIAFAALLWSKLTQNKDEERLTIKCLLLEVLLNFSQLTRRGMSR